MAQSVELEQIESLKRAHEFFAPNFGYKFDLPDDVHQAALIPTAYYTGSLFHPAARQGLESVLHLDRW